MRFLNLKTKFYQASTSELFGEKPKETNSFDENSLMIPKSPYVSKLYSYFINKIYREAYGFMHATEFKFNHESPEEVKLLLQEKLQCFAKKILGLKKYYI